MRIGRTFGMLHFMGLFPLIFSFSSSITLQVVAKFGMMHLVATNVCIVIRTLVKESAHEFIHGKPNSLENQNNSEETVEEKLKKINMSKKKAEMILNALNNNEFQYIQQLKRKSNKKLDLKYIKIL